MNRLNFTQEIQPITFKTGKFGSLLLAQFSLKIYDNFIAIVLR
jgi:hypothetical protein